jgi:hypothetical protein
VCTDLLSLKGRVAILAGVVTQLAVRRQPRRGGRFAARQIRLRAVERVYPKAEGRRRVEIMISHSPLQSKPNVAAITTRRLAGAAASALIEPRLHICLDIAHSAPDLPEDGALPFDTPAFERVVLDSQHLCGLGAREQTAIFSIH